MSIRLPLKSMDTPRVFLRYFYTRLYVYPGYKGNNYCFALWSRGKIWIRVSFIVSSFKHVPNRFMWDCGPVLRVFPFFFAVGITNSRGVK